jgi:hypothetical protein
LFACDLSRQLAQALSVFVFTLAFRLHIAFPWPVAEWPVFGFLRRVRE